MQLICECPDLRRRIPFTSVHPKGQSHYQGADFPDPGEVGDPLDGIGFRAFDGFNRVSHDAEVVCRGDADACIAVIDAKRRVRGVREIGCQTQDGKTMARIRENPEQSR